MKENPKTQFIFESDGQVITQELSQDATIQDICNAFYTTCVYKYGETNILEILYKLGSKELLQDSIYQCKSFLVWSPCTMTLVTNNVTTKIEFTECKTGTDLCQALYMLCLSAAFISSDIYNAMKDYAEKMFQLQIKTVNNI